MFGVGSKTFDQIPVYVRGTFIDIATFGKNRAISTFESPIAPQDYVSAVITL